MDEVFSYGWAYGSKGDKLRGKRFGIAMSIGDKEENYSPGGSVSFTVDEVIAPFKASMNHVGAVVLPYFAVFGSSFQASDEHIAQSARDYADYIFRNH
ncbi:General stress protein 14 [compost metagenome]